MNPCKVLQTLATTLPSEVVSLLLLFAETKEKHVGILGFRYSPAGGGSRNVNYFGVLRAARAPPELDFSDGPCASLARASKKRNKLQKKKRKKEKKLARAALARCAS